MIVLKKVFFVSKYVFFKKKIFSFSLARKNSIRLKNKNILKLGNIPLIVRTFKLLTSLNNLFVDIMVSSDSLVIKIIHLIMDLNF